MEENKITYQLNPLLEAQKDFNVMETRIFYLGLQDLNPHITEKDKFYDECFPDTVITPSELTKIFGHTQYITEVDRATDNLIGRYISIRFEDGFEKYTIFQHIKYREGQGLFIKFNEDMRPFILDIYKSYKKYGFTKIEMQQIFCLGSAYAMRLLELLLKYRYKAVNGIIEREIGIDDLREKLNVPENAYKGRMGNFRQFVLEKPIEDINKKTQYFITYETIKKGRSVSGFKFICNCNKVTTDDEYKETIDEQPFDEKKSILEDPSIKKDNELISKLVNYGFSIDTIEHLSKMCGGFDELSKRMAYGEKRAKQDKEEGKAISNISGYLRRAIEDNWLQAKMNEKKSQERELQSVKENADWELWVHKNFSHESAPDVEENPLDKSNEIHKTIINMIKSDIKNRNLSYSSKEILKERGLTVARFVELYI